MEISSYALGFNLWLWCLVLAKVLAGTFWLILGLFLYGIGVVFVAFIASLFQAEWAIAGQIVLTTVVVYGMRLLGRYFTFSPEERAFERDYKNFLDGRKDFFTALKIFNMKTKIKRPIIHNEDLLPYPKTEMIQLLKDVAEQHYELYNRAFNHFDKKKGDVLFSLFEPIDTAKIYIEDFVTIEDQDKEAVQYFNSFSTIDEIPEERKDEYWDLWEKYYVSIEEKTF